MFHCLSLHFELCFDVLDHASRFLKKDGPFSPYIDKLALLESPAGTIVLDGNSLRDHYNALTANDRNAE